MEVILQEKVQNLGDLGDKVRVKAGYGRNFLIPTGKAVPATAENVAKLEARRAELEKAASEALNQAQARAAKLEGQRIVLKHKVGEEGKLFGSVGTIEIAEALTVSSGSEVAKREIMMPEGPIRQIGEHDIAIHLYTDVNVTVTVVIEPEE